MGNRWRLLVCGAALLLGAVCWAPQILAAGGEPAPAGVSVDYLPPLVVLHVAQPVPLRAVLEELCRATASRCELDAVPGDATLPALSLTGTWEEVVAKLLDGSKLNYAAVGPRGTEPGRLVVSARPKGVVAQAQAPAPPEAEAGESPASTGLKSSVLLKQQGQGEPETSSRSAPAGGFPTEALPSQAPAGGGKRVTPVEETSSTAAPAPNVPLPAFMGGPVIPATVPLGSPFPDVHGNPVPMDNQPLTFSPFPDAQGRPVPVTPAPPGTRIGSPFPPQLTGPRP